MNWSFTFLFWLLLFLAKIKWINCQQEHEQYTTYHFLKKKDLSGPRRNTQDTRDWHIFSGVTMGPQLRAQAKRWPIFKPKKLEYVSKWIVTYIAI